MRVVMTFKVPPNLRVSGGGGGEAMLASRNPGVFGSCAEIFDVYARIDCGVCHEATEMPCMLGSPAVATTPNWNNRVCLPASISTLIAESFAHVMCSRAGSRMMFGAP